MNETIGISYYMRGIIFRIQHLLEEIKNDGKDVERFLKDVETLQSDYDYQKTKWFQGSDKEIILRIYRYINEVYDRVILPKTERKAEALSYVTKELNLSTSTIEKIEKKRLEAVNIKQIKELEAVLSDMKNLYFLNYSQAEFYCKKKEVKIISSDRLQTMHLPELKRVDDYKYIQVYFKSDYSIELPELYNKLKQEFEEDLTKLKDWCGAVEIGTYYLVL